MILNEDLIHQFANPQPNPFSIIRKQPIFGLGYQLALDRIAMDITAKSNQVFPFIHALMLKATFEQSTRAFLLQIQRLSIRVKQHLHKFREGFVRLLPEQKVIMIRHQTIRNDRHAVLLRISLHQSQKVPIIPFVEENLSLSRAAVVDMIILA